MSTPAERATDLLEIHGGNCFVPAGSDLIAPFLEMENAGLVTVSASSGEVQGFSVRSAGFTPTIEPPEDHETPAY